jgi:hypothetical protein
MVSEIRSMLLDALECAALFRNVIPTRALDGVTPEPKEAWLENKPDVSRVRIFGSREFSNVHIPDK